MMRGPGERWSPAGLLAGADAQLAVESGLALPLADGPSAFSLVIRHRRGGEPQALRLDDAPADVLSRFTRSRPAFCGFSTDRPRLMGIVNVTPDSFSDGGDHLDPASAVAHGLALAEAGADLIDVGGLSTRPGSDPVSEAEEGARVLPVVEALAAAGLNVSVDTYRPGVAAAAVALGARVINDVTGLGDPDMVEVVVATRTPVVLMHMRGMPKTMQEAPVYADVLLDIADFFEERIETCLAAGMALEQFCLDPGIGFGKTVEHNLSVLDGFPVFHGFGCPLLIGASRKAFLAHVDRGGTITPKRRLGGSIAAALGAVRRGAQWLRVHDVEESRQALALWSALAQRPAPAGTGEISIPSGRWFG